MVIVDPSRHEFSKQSIGNRQSYSYCTWWGRCCWYYYNCQWFQRDHYLENVLITASPEKQGLVLTETILIMCDDRESLETNLWEVYQM